MRLELIATLSFLLLVPVTGLGAPALHLELSRGELEYPISVQLQFAEPVSAVDFSTTPYNFVSGDWLLDANAASLNHAALTIELHEPQKNLHIEVSRANNDFIRGFYTPFLNFSDGGQAIFVGHYLPKRIKTSRGWQSLEQQRITLTITSSENEYTLFAGLSNVQDTSITPAQSMQYAYFGKQALQSSNEFHSVFDPGLPSWMQDTFADKGLEIFQQLTIETGVELPFKPLLMVAYQPGSQARQSDGGVSNHQVTLNFIGSGWDETPDQHKQGVLSLWAHELVHLWNSQYWEAEGPGLVWLSEGSADFLARALLLEAGVLSPIDYHAQSREQVEICNRILNETPLEDIRRRADHYVCGEAIFYAATGQSGGSEEAFRLWRTLVNQRDGLSYSREDLIAVIQNQGLSEIYTARIIDVIKSVVGAQLEVISSKE